VRDQRWWTGALLLFPRTIADNLERAERAGIVEHAPNLVQVSLGVIRMWFRVATRPETIGTCREHRVRPTMRARLLHWRPLRFPFLLRERAIAPLDFSGLASSRERILRHLLGAHHDANQFAYDLELLGIHPGALEELHERVRGIVTGEDPRAEWLRDLVVFENYHESLLAAVERALEGRVQLAPHEAGDPDIALSAYLRWCAEQPSTWREALPALIRGEIDLSAYSPAGDSPGLKSGAPKAGRSPSGWQSSSVAKRVVRALSTLRPAGSGELTCGDMFSQRTESVKSGGLEVQSVPRTSVRGDSQSSRRVMA